MLLAAAYAAYFTLGIVIGARWSTHLAWRLRLKKDPYALTPRFFQDGGPTFLLLGCICAWPLMGFGYFLGKTLVPRLFAPPADVRKRLEGR